MHEKNKFGDSLIGTRFSVEKANRLQNPVEGFEEGRTFNGYRFIFPLFYEMEHIGSIGIGISACSMIENMNKLYEGLHDFIIKKNVVNSRVFQADTYNYSPTTVSEDYLRENLSFEQLSGENSIFENIQEFFTTNRINYEKVNKNISQGKAFSVFNKVNGKDLITTFFPIFNVEGKHIGYITNYVKDSRIPKLSNMVSFTILAGTITIIFIFGFIYQVILNFEKSRLLNSVLDEKLKENAQQLELKEQMLFQQSKLATLGEMFSALAHQWKQPLNILAMYIQSMLDEEMDENERQEREELIDRCMIQITYMSETINDFMDFIKPSSNVASKTELVKSTEDVIRLLTPSLKNKKIDIKVSIENDIHGKIYAYGNPNEIRHILVNIINNAKDAIMEIKETNRKFHGKIDIKILSEKNKSIIVTQVSHL
jgi:signal transduction histidine kinase